VCVLEFTAPSGERGQTPTPTWKATQPGRRSQFQDTHVCPDSRSGQHERVCREMGSVKWAAAGIQSALDWTKRNRCKKRNLTSFCDLRQLGRCGPESREVHAVAAANPMEDQSRSPSRDRGRDKGVCGISFICRKTGSRTCATRGHAFAFMMRRNGLLNRTFEWGL
jgi:hypothetical protein